MAKMTKSLHFLRRLSFQMGLCFILLGAHLVACSTAGGAKSTSTENPRVIAKAEAESKNDGEKKKTQSSQSKKQAKESKVEEKEEASDLKQAAGEKNKKEDTLELKRVKFIIKAYKKAKSVYMRVDKSVFLALMEEQKESEGELWFSKGKMNLNIEKPESTKLVLDGKFVWMVSTLPEEFGGTIQVTKMDAERVTKANAFLAVLFDKEDIWDQFKVKGGSIEGDIFNFEMVPKSEKISIDVTKLSLKVDGRKKEILEVEYFDNLENKTTYRFSKIKFNKKVPRSKFKYSPPKGAEVTEL